ncbi:2'-5' RNA ligase family protein [Maricurvus nonylphenolicus]|uniref:2'-5' RNA ligase family protein n=1 Tax=Maricurvus nonylphenolicus TaxID=1008307 RepID=UPI0036F27847
MYDPETWQAFLQSSHTLPTSKREYPEWHQGRSRFCVWAILLEQASIVSLQRQAQSWLQDYLLLPYSRQPHITLTACGFWQPEAALQQEDNFSGLQQHLQLLDSAELSPFELQLGGLNSFTTVPFFEVSDPGAMLGKLRQSLPSYFETIRQVPYCPHVTIGCYNKAWPTADIAKRIQAFPPVAPVTIKVEQIALLSYSTKDIGSSLEVEYSYKL